MSDVEDFFQGSAQSAKAGFVGSMDDDPEVAARSVELEDASGVPASAIYGDVDGFERNHKAAMGSSIIGDNPYIADYLNSHPMAPRISHDDLGQLDIASQAIGKIQPKGYFQRTVDAFKEGFGEASAKAFLSDPFIKTDADRDAFLAHPLLLGTAMAIGDLVAAPLVGISKTASGVNSVINEFGGREAAGLAEYLMMRGDIKSSPTHNTVLEGQLYKDAVKQGISMGPQPTEIAKVLTPWIRAGKEPPIGLHPEIDKMKVQQAREDSSALSEALAESVKAATRDRSAEFFANFVKLHPEAQGEIGIPADVVREMYGDKPPTVDDGKLGFVEGLDQKLAHAEAIGGDVKIPTADWLAHVEPDVARELKDDIRAREGGVTLNEAKELSERKQEVAEAADESGKAEPGPISEPLPLVRGSAALEPLFSVGDRKLTIQRREPGKMNVNADGSIRSDEFKLLDENGQNVGWVEVIPYEGGKKLYIDNIGGMESKGYGPNNFGPALTRDIARQLKKEYPQAEQFGGFRVSGAREKAGTEREVWMKFEDLGKPGEWQHIHDGWTKIQEGVQGKPIEMTPEKQKVVDAVNEVLDRIAPKGVGVEGFEKIRSDNGGRKGGVYSRYEDAAPWISWSLESPDPVATARHEAIHHLRQSGFFAPEEWATLSRAARDQDWVKQYRINERYGDLGNEGKLEESIADAFKNWAKKPEAETPLGKIFSRIKEIIDAIRSKLKEAFGGEVSFEDIFKRVESGEVGEREATGPIDPRVYSAESLDKEKGIPDIGGKEAEKLRERITALKGELDVAKSQGFDIKGEDYAERVKELTEARASLRSITSGTFGMTADQYARYQKLIERRHAEDLQHASKAALEYQRKAQTKEWKSARSDMRDQVREEMESEPHVALDQMMAQEKVKFHPDSLTPEQRESLPKDYLQKKDGIVPDDLAGYLGYHSGDALVSHLASITAERKASGLSAREWLNKTIDAETDRRMAIEHGDLNQKILEEAKDQAISETQLNLLHEEVLHLGLKAGSEFPISKAQLRAWNKEIFDKTKISDISTDEYLRIAGKAGKAAEMSLLKEDYADAFREKQRQNNAMIMASYAKEYERARKSFDRSAKQFSKREIPSISQEWTNWIHDILQRTGNRVNRSVQDLAENIGRQSEKTLTDFIEAKEAETFGLRETPVADYLLDPNFRGDMKSLTADQFYGLKNAVDTLAKQGRDEKKIIVAGEAADRDAVLREMRDKLGTFPAKPAPDERGVLDRALDRPRMFLAGMTNIETLMNRWDRADPRGIFNRYVTYPLAKAANYKSALEREYARAYGELGEIKDGGKFVDAPFADPRTRTEQNPEGRPWPGFTRKHVLAMLQNAGNKSNWRVLAKGYSADPEALMSWLHQNTTKEDWDRAQKMGDTIFHSLVQKADVVYENLTGATVEKIPLEPIETPFGTYKGWYHPLIKDPLRQEVWVKDADTGTWQRNATGKRGSVMDDSDYFHASTANGYTKRRTGAVYPLDLNFDVVPSRIKQMIHDIAFRDTIIQTEKIFGNKAFQTEVGNHYGDIYKDLLMPYLKAMAGAESIPSRAGAEASRISEYLRQNVISTYIGFNPYTALKHGPTALLMSSREVGPMNFANAVRSLYGQSPELGVTNSEFAMKHSEELQRRERHWQDTIAGQHNEIEGASTLREKIIEKGSWLVAQSDMLSAKPTWVAKYNASIADGLSHGESVDLADRAVRRAHGSTAETNQPALVRGGGALHGWLTSVYGFFGTAMQRRIEIAQKMNDAYSLGREGEIASAAKKIPGIAADIMTYVIWPTLVEEWVTGLNQDDRRGLGQRLLSAGSMGVASSVLYLRDLVHALATGQDPGAGLISSPLHDIANVARDLRKGREAFNRQHAAKTIGDTLTVFGEGTGMMPKTVANATRFGIDLVNKQQQPKTLPDYLRGFTRGTSKVRIEK